jgi:hypothetical protein
VKLHLDKAIIFLQALILLVGNEKVIADRKEPLKPFNHREYTGLAPDTLSDCEWRKCAIGDGSLKCKADDQACDMFRNQCVPDCQGTDCCSGVDCPEGTVCVPGIGRCGIPVGQGCYDMGTEWWTGRDIPDDRFRDFVNPAPAVFVLYNDGKVPIYFESGLNLLVRFNLFLQYCGRIYKLEIPENHFCPDPCPDQGSPMEIDCGKPPRIAQCLPVGEHVSMQWSGLEQVIMWRICDNLPIKSCLVDRVTVPGIYTIEVCAYKSISGGKPDAANPNRMIGATLTGECERLRLDFQHPATGPLMIRFND